MLNVFVRDEQYPPYLFIFPVLMQHDIKNLLYIAMPYYQHSQDKS